MDIALEQRRNLPVRAKIDSSGGSLALWSARQVRQHGEKTDRPCWHLFSSTAIRISRRYVHSEVKLDNQILVSASALPDARSR
jgi:hypothetical protein